MELTAKVNWDDLRYTVEAVYSEGYDGKGYEPDEAATVSIRSITDTDGNAYEETELNEETREAIYRRLWELARLGVRPKRYYLPNATTDNLDEVGRGFKPLPD